MGEDKKAIEKLIDALISYIEFINNFKQVKKEQQIKGSNSLPNFSYIFREFSTECYLIDKKPFFDFRNSLNFNQFSQILDPLNDGNKINFIKK